MVPLAAVQAEWVEAPKQVVAASPRAACVDRDALAAAGRAVCSRLASAHWRIVPSKGHAEAGTLAELAVEREGHIAWRDVPVARWRMAGKKACPPD